MGLVVKEYVDMVTCGLLLLWEQYTDKISVCG